MTDTLLLGDVHLTDEARRPTSRKPGYTQQILDKLQFCVDKANKLDVPIVQAGDMFHLKASTKNSHKLVQQTHDVLKNTNKGVWIVPGNHDMAYDRLDSLDSQPLGALARMDNIELLLGHDTELPGILGIPYLTEFDGGDWLASLDSYLQKNNLVKFNVETDLIVTHAPMFPLGQEPGVYAHVDLEQWSDMFPSFKATFYGHIHDYHGVYKVNQMTFCNQGAISRGSLHESSVARIPACTYWHEGVFERIEIPHLEAKEVFIFEKAQEKIKNAQSAQSFAEAIGTSSLEQLTLEEVLDTLKGQVSSKEVLDVIEDVFESVK